MIHNIFKHKTRTKKPKPTQLIVADIHEKNSLVISELHKSTQVRLKIKSLKIADYIINDIAIEKRKKVKLIIKELKAIDESILKVNPSYLSERLGQTSTTTQQCCDRTKWAVWWNNQWR